MHKDPIPPHVQLAVMSRQYVVSRAIHAIAHLGIADHMSEQPISIAQLATLTQTIPDLLERVLNFLSLYGLFNKCDEGYSLTELSMPLKTDDPHSIKDILCMVDESWWQAFAHLDTELRNGVPGFKQGLGIDFLSHISQNERFQKGVAKLSQYDDKAIAQAFDFSAFKHLIILGAAKKDASSIIAEKNPQIKISNYTMSTSLKGLPKGDLYFIKGILHDFEDDQISKMMNALKLEMPQNATLLIAEQVLPDDNLPHTNKTMDIIMMVLVGGRQRHLADWIHLIESAGFKLKNNLPTQGVYTLMEFSVDAALR